MERFMLRILVLVLLGSSVGLGWGLVRETSGHRLMLGLPPQPPRQTTTAPAGPSGPSGILPAAPTGAPGATGGTGSVAGTPVAPPAPAATGAPDHNEDYFIALTRAKELYDKMTAGENIVFVDAREFVEFRETHIAGALSIPKRRFDGAFPKELREAILGNTIVVYCHGELCTDSEAVVKRMIALKLPIGPYYIIKDGLPGWEKAGYPMEGEKVKAPR